MFLIVKNMKTCVDINECQDRNGDCEQICNNSQGSYNCACGGGYIPDKSNRKKCKKIENYNYDSYSELSGEFAFCGHTQLAIVQTRHTMERSKEFTMAEGNNF